MIPPTNIPPPLQPMAPMMNAWETGAYNHNTSSQGMSELGQAGQRHRTHDPMIYPGLYSATGFDMMSILLQVMSRPSPVIELGPIDCSVAMVVCDLDHPNFPIVYCSDTFSEMSGYPRKEVLGKNFGFLLLPPRMPRARQSQLVDKVAVHRTLQALQHRKEVQVQMLNFKRTGQPFTNIISIIPVGEGPNGSRYAVGLQADMS